MAQLIILLILTFHILIIGGAIFWQPKIVAVGIFVLIATSVVGSIFFICDGLRRNRVGTTKIELNELCKDLLITKTSGTKLIIQGIFILFLAPAIAYIAIKIFLWK